MKEALKKFIVGANDFVIDLVIAIIIIVVGFKIVSLIIHFMKKPHKYGKLDPTVKSFLISFLNIALKIFVIVIALQVIGISSASILTVIGSCAVAIGLALQGGLSNIAGGLMILIFKPFKVGDYINTCGFEGTVKSITMFYTVITTIDNKIIQLPNGNLSNNNIVNYSANPQRRVDIDLSVSYNSDIDKVKKVVNKVIESEELILKDMENTVRLKTHDESALVFTLRAWVNTPDYWTVYFNLMEKIKVEFDKNGIEIPFNQIDVHMK